MFTSCRPPRMLPQNICALFFWFDI
uniref:Uncharacterized protein n=1 Tax=Anguilla anguilla TaxID=7936 RepID=A0A0E9T5L6_ANGAN